jgi:hypothetical protein
MNDGINYEIRARREWKPPNNYQWVYVCRHPDCGDAEHGTASRDAGDAQRAAEDHARVHPDDHANISVEVED